VQPDLATQLAGIRRVLQEVVAPALGDRFAGAQLASVCDALGLLALRWPRELGLLLRESAELGALLGELAPELARCPDAGRARDLAARAAAAAQSAAPPLAPGAEEPALRAAHRALRGLLSEAIRALREHPDAAEREALRARIRSQLAAALERRLAPAR